MLTAPVAIAFDAVSYVVSAACAALVRVESTSSKGGAVQVRAEIAAGVRLVFGDAILSPLVVSATLGAAAGAMQSALVVLYFVRDLSFSPAFVGSAVAITGAASIVGVLLAPSLGERLGPGPTYVVGGFLAATAGLILAAAQVPLVVVAGCVALGQIVAGLGQPLYSVQQASMRQSRVPDDILGRVNATWRFLVFGGQPLGAVAGGLLGSAIGLRATLVVASVGILLGWLWAVKSPILSVRHLESVAGPSRPQPST